MLQLAKIITEKEPLGFITDNLKAICESQPCVESVRHKYFKDNLEFCSWITSKEFTLDTVMKYRNEFLHKRTDIGAGTKNGKLAALRMLMKELYLRKFIDVEISYKLRNFKTESGHKKDGLNISEIQSIQTYIESIKETECFNKYSRVNAMFYLLAFQGLRQAEICNVSIEDFNAKDASLKIQGKGMSEKTRIDLHPDTVKAIAGYLETYNLKSGFLFTSEKGKTIGERMSESGLRKYVKTIFGKLDIENCTHGFRHFFVTTLLEATNGNIGIVKKFSRHKSTVALEMYDDRKIKKSNNQVYYSAFKTF